MGKLAFVLNSNGVNFNFSFFIFAIIYIIVLNSNGVNFNFNGGYFECEVVVCFKLQRSKF